MRRFLLSMFLLLGLGCSQTGCWDRFEVEDLEIVQALAVERAPEGRVRLFVQSISPKHMVRSSGGVTSIVSEEPYRNRSIVSDTVFEAIRDLARQSPHRLFFIPNELVLVSEAYAREVGIGEVLDLMERNPEARRIAWLVIVQGDLGALLDEPGRIVPIPSMNILEMIKRQNLTDQFATIRVGDFIELLENEGIQPYTGMVRLIPNEAKPQEEVDLVPEPDLNIEMNGTAVFREDKMVGWLSPRESRGLLWLRGEVKGGRSIKVMDGLTEKPVTLQILHAKTKLRPEIREGQIYITVDLQVESRVVETRGPLNLEKPEVLRRLEEEQAEVIKAEIEAALTKAQQEYGVDVFGFGEVVHRHYPQEWKEMKMEWPAFFPRVQVGYQMKSIISRTGEFSRPVFRD